MVFENCWKIGDHDVQSAVIAGCVSQTLVKCHKVSTEEKSSSTAKNSRLNFGKSLSRNYSLPLADRRVDVCRTMFCAALGISSSRINTVLKNRRENGGVPSLDKRGKHDHSKQRLSIEAVEAVVAHIKSYPVNESHYTRSHSANRRYLSPSLTLSKMYEMYVQKCNSLEMLNFMHAS